MQVHLETERVSAIIAQDGQLGNGPKVVSAITFVAGTAATGGLLILDNSTDGTGTYKWILSAPQYGSASICFPKPIPFSVGCYVTMTGTAPSVAIAYT